MSEEKQSKEPVKAEKNNSPIQALNNDKVKTKVTDWKAIVEEKMQQLKDLATMEYLLPNETRVRHRLKSIKEMSSAKHIKVRGQHKTTAPQMFIAKLEAKKISNDESQISFGVYEVDEKGNKKLHERYAEVVDRDGNTKKIPTSADYQIAYEVTETIRNGKPITREIMELNVQE